MTIRQSIGVSTAKCVRATLPPIYQQTEYFVSRYLRGRRYYAGPGAPVVLFFFGGGWVDGTYESVDAPAKALAARGVTVIAMEYRVMFRHKDIVTQVVDCCADAMAAYNWARANFGNVCVGGSSAGGHLALHVALTASVAPAKVLAFNPPTIIGTGGYQNIATDTLSTPQKQSVSLTDMLVASPKAIAPTLIVHGDADVVVSLANSQTFATAATGAGGTCTVSVKAGMGHGGWNFEPYFTPCMDEAAAFLKS